MASYAHIGRGWAFPLRPTNGRLQFVDEEQSVDQGIELVLRTALGERVMRPQFGAGLRDHVFQPNTPSTQRSIENEVRSALVRWEPRIDLEEVRAYSSPTEANLLLLEINYRLRRNNAAHNRVFPFYLTEAG